MSENEILEKGSNIGSGSDEALRNELNDILIKNDLKSLIHLKKTLKSNVISKEDEKKALILNKNLHLIEINELKSFNFDFNFSNDSGTANFDISKLNYSKNNLLLKFIKDLPLILRNLIENHNIDKANELYGYFSHHLVQFNLVNYSYNNSNFGQILQECQSILNKSSSS